MSKQCLALLLIAVISGGFLAACVVQEQETPQLKIAGIPNTAGQIIPGKPLPKFQDGFDAETTTVRSYVQLVGMETTTESVVVRMQWFSQNDLRAPIFQRVITVLPQQNVAEFTLHNTAGLPAGPYQVIAFAGTDHARLTTSGSSRFFIGMTRTEALEFLEKETKVRNAMEEKRGANER